MSYRALVAETSILQVRICVSYVTSNLATTVWGTRRRVQTSYFFMRLLFRNHRRWSSTILASALSPGKLGNYRLKVCAHVCIESTHNEKNNHMSEFRKTAFSRRRQSGRNLELEHNEKNNHMREFRKTAFSRRTQSGGMLELKISKVPCGCCYSIYPGRQSTAGEGLGPG